MTDAKQGKTVLVIDDQTETRDLIAMTLRGSEFTCLEAANGKEGIQTARTKRPDLILLDIMMPGFDGFTTSTILRRNIATRDIPIIFISAKKTKEDIAAAIGAGAVDYIIKPFSPSDLLTRLRKLIGSMEAIKAKKADAARTQALAGTPGTDPSKPGAAEAEASRVLKNRLIRRGDIMIFNNVLPAISIANCNIFRNLFAAIMSDGLFKVVLNMEDILDIDAAGLGLLLSFQEALGKYGGALAPTFPKKEVNTRFSYTKFTELIHCHENIEEAMSALKTMEPPEASEDTLNINLCLSCSTINRDDARYCSFCGTNLMIARGDNVLTTLRRTISHKLEEDGSIEEAKKSQEMAKDDLVNIIPSEFMVEIYDKNIAISYISHNTFRGEFTKSQIIGIEAPNYRGKTLNLQPGTTVRLQVAKQLSFEAFETAIERLDPVKGMLFVKYDEEAIAMHLQKNFSVAPKLPIPLQVVAPSLDKAGTIYNAKILELSRIRMAVFCEDLIPANEPLAVSFELPELAEISSPFVVAQKRKSPYMYDMEFVVFDEKDRSRLMQYMYKRQIEMASLEG